MKSWFLRLIAVFMAFVLCVAISACGKDDAGEENSLAPGQTASGEVDSFSTGNSTPLEPGTRLIPCQMCLLRRGNQAALHPTRQHSKTIRRQSRRNQNPVR